MQAPPQMAGSPCGAGSRCAQCPGDTPSPRHPMNVEAALGAVEGEVLELALEVGLHLQELEPEHLRVDRDRMIASTGSLRLVDELVRLRRLLGDGVDGVLEDLAFSSSHDAKARPYLRPQSLGTSGLDGLEVDPIQRELLSRS
jgi:hypothetical protein